MSRSTGPHSNQAANHFSLLMVGYYATGKTALLHRFSRHTFEEDYHMTLSLPYFTQILPTRPEYSTLTRTFRSNWLWLTALAAVSVDKGWMWSFLLVMRSCLYMISRSRWTLIQLRIVLPAWQVDGWDEEYYQSVNAAHTCWHSLGPALPQKNFWGGGRKMEVQQQSRTSLWDIQQDQWKYFRYVQRDMWEVGLGQQIKINKFKRQPRRVNDVWGQPFKSCKKEQDSCLIEKT